MPKLLIGSVILSLFLFPVLSQNAAPTIRLVGSPTTVQEESYANLAIIADDPDGPNSNLTYNWSIASDPTGKAGYFVNPDVVSSVTARTSVQAAVGAGPAYPNASFIGNVVTYRVEVSDGANIAFLDIPLTVNGVNRHPILAFDTSRLGTQSNPRLFGEGLSIDARGSRDPDGTSVKFLFRITGAEGGSVCPDSGLLVLQGKETSTPGFSVPKVTALPSNPMRIIVAVIVEDGLFVHQQNFTGYIASPNGCSSGGGGTPTALVATPTATPSGPTFGQTVTLRANASGGRTPYSYSWTQLSASTGVNIVGSSNAVASFVAPSAAQVLSIQLSVTDSDQRQVTKTLNIPVSPSGGGGDPGGGSGDPGSGSGTATGTTECSQGGNSPGIGSVPASFTIEGGNVATISVSSGRDPDNTTVFVSGQPISGVTYLWTVANGGGFLSNGNLSGENTKTVSINTPQVSQQSSAVVSVVVNDAAGCGTRYNVNLTVTPVQNPQPNNNPPNAVLRYRIDGGALTVASGQAVSLVSPVGLQFEASASTDSDGTISNVAFGWQQNLNPGGGALSTQPNSASLQIQSGSAGTFSVTVTVTDDDGATDTDTQQFIVEEPDIIPVAVAAVRADGASLNSGDSVSEGALVTLDGSGSNLPEGDSSNLTYRWRQVEGPLVSMLGSDQAQATFRAPQSDSANAALRFELVVFNGLTPSEPVYVEVRVVIPALFFSQVAFGPFADEIFRTVLVLVNSQDEAAEEVTIEFFDQQGDPLAVSLDGVAWDPDTPFRLGSTVSRRFEFSAQDEEGTFIGWARIRADARLTGLVLYQLLDRNTRKLNSEVSLFATQRGSRFTTFFGVDDGLAAAIANPGDTQARIIVKLIDEDFGPDLPLVQKPIILEPGQQLATFLDENYFGFLPAGFDQGTLVVETVAGRIAMTVLKTQGGVAISTLPLARR